jgi:hypothetical protein
MSQGPVDTCEVKIADFGLSALVRLDEDGYDAEESGKRKRYTALKEVSEQCGVCVAVCSFLHCGRAFAALRADCVCQYTLASHMSAPYTVLYGVFTAVGHAAPSICDRWRARCNRVCPAEFGYFRYSPMMVRVFRCGAPLSTSPPR